MLLVQMKKKSDQQLVNANGQSAFRKEYMLCYISDGIDE